MIPKTYLTAIFCFFLLSPPALSVADTIEFLSGAKVEGTVRTINKAGKSITFEARIAGRMLTRVYPYGKIHAVTYKGKRYVLNQQASAAATSGTGGSSGDSESAQVLRPTAEVQKLINGQGRTPPDWYESTPLEYPKTLDLNWPMPAPQPWNNQKNVGQYIWDIINPNENRWQSGVRFMHHLLTLHKDDAAVRARAMRSLAAMYFQFFQDYARAAFWWRLSGVGPGDPDSVTLAECYWRLGNKNMAKELLNHRIMRPQMIKLWGDMGETATALALADRYIRAGGAPHLALLYAGDACRVAGNYEQAVGYYQKVIDAPSDSNQGHVDQTIARARASLEAIRLFELSDPARVPDGTYNGVSLGYEDDIEVQVTVRDGRIESVDITKHREKQFYSALTDIPQQIIQKQGVKGVDATSRATITAEAIINAAAKALAGGADRSQ